MGTNVIIRAGWLIDGSGGPISRGVALRLENGRILSVDVDGAAARAGAGEAAGSEIDLSGCTVLPGLVDAHAHLSMSGAKDQALRQAQLAAGFDQIRSTISLHLAHHLAWGVTAVRDGGDRQGHVLRYKSETAGGSPGTVELKVAGRAWKAPGRYGRLIGRCPSGQMTLAQAIAAESDPVDHIKIVNSGLNSLEDWGKQTAPQFNLEEMTEAVRAAGRRGLGVMAHANGREPVAISVAAGCRSVEHGYFMGKDNLERMAEAQVFWVPTALPMRAYAKVLRENESRRDVARRTLDHQIEQIELARRLGVPVAVGTDAGSLGVHHGRGVSAEMRLLMQAGFPLSEAVACAAGNGARLLGIERHGCLSRGMWATMVAVPGGPEGLPESLERISRVFVDGVQVLPPR